MIILGLDPGTATTGYGVIRVLGNRFQMLEYGVITTPAGLAMEKRLEMIYDGLNELIAKWQPEQAAIEELFFNQNITTGISVAEARGVVLLVARQHNLPTYEYTPLQIKQTLTGYGRANKKQMQESVRQYLKMRDIVKPDDAADALAAAITHALMTRAQYDLS